MADVRDRLGDPAMMSAWEQHKALMGAVRTTLEFAVEAGFREDAAALAAAAASVYFAVKSDQASSQRVVAALRYCADEVERRAGDKHD